MVIGSTKRVSRLGSGEKQAASFSQQDKTSNKPKVKAAHKRQWKRQDGSKKPKEQHREKGRSLKTWNVLEILLLSSCNHTVKHYNHINSQRENTRINIHCREEFGHHRRLHSAHFTLMPRPVGRRRKNEWKWRQKVLYQALRNFYDT